MVELREHPECDAIERIRIVRPVTTNWDISVRRSTTRVCPLKLLAIIVHRLRSHYDLLAKK
jgi:hypothetical protein